MDPIVRDAYAADPAGFDDVTLFDMAVEVGVVDAPSAPELPTSAEAMIAEFLAAWNIRRAPFRGELALLHQVIAKHGAAETWAAVQAAHSKVLNQVRSGRGQAPYSLFYLRPHLTLAKLPDEREPDQG